MNRTIEGLRDLVRVMGELSPSEIRELGSFMVRFDPELAEEVEFAIRTEMLDRMVEQDPTLALDPVDLG